MQKIHNLEIGDHICCIYENPTQHKQIISSFIIDGLKKNDKILYFTNLHSKEQIIGYITEKIDNLRPYLDSGQLEILHSNETYLENGLFDPDKMIHKLKRHIDEGIEQGYRCVRFTGEMTWALNNKPGTEKLIEYEIKLNEELKDYKVIAICQYKRDMFSPQTLLDVLMSHPYAVIGMKSYRNFYYIPPDKRKNKDINKLKLDHWLKNLQKYNEIKKDLEETKERYLRIFNKIPTGLIIFNEEGKLEDVNPATCDIYGYSKGEMLKLQPKDFVHKNFLNVFQEFLKETQQGKDFYANSKDIRKNGEVLDIEVHGTPFQMNGEKHLLAMIHDVTERKNAQKEREEIIRKMLHSQKLESLGVLAGGIAHDFNNILMGILGNADLAREYSDPNSEIYNFLEDIILSTKRASDLAKQMLAYSGKGKFNVKRVNINEIIREMGKLLKVSISKKTVLKYELEESIPLIKGDVTQIRQIIMNLITNASEAIGEKEGVISIKTQSLECDENYIQTTYLNQNLSPGKYISLEIADNGCGMEKTTQKKIFDPFFSTKFTGRGLGLSAVLGIVKAHKGAIKVYSELGKGSTFKIIFPRYKKGKREQRVMEQKKKAIKKQKKYRILVVDDESTVLRTTKRMLEKMEHTVITKKNGEEALKYFKIHSNDIDCVLCDLTMPKMDGEEAYRRLRSINPEIKVILTSGYSEQDIMTNFRGKKLSGFLQKPYRYQDLEKTLHSVFQNKRR